MFDHSSQLKLLPVIALRIFKRYSSKIFISHMRVVIKSFMGSESNMPSIACLLDDIFTFVLYHQFPNYARTFLLYFYE